jgi:alanine transaminase
MAVINPSNPTGAVLKQEHIFGILKFAHKHGILLIGDEVYQHNIYTGHQFISLRKAAHTIEPPYNNVSIVSLHSVSKGYSGEGGMRGAYMDFYNVDPEVLKQIHKMRDPYNINITGSIAMGILCNPPTYENASKEVTDQYNKERDEILNSLETKVKMTMEMFSQCKGVKCQPINGALYAFPRVFLPESVIELAKKEKLKPCEYFCKRMLEETGIITTPGSVFGQEVGTYHFRISLLVWDLKEFAEILELMKKFINKFFDAHK